MHVNQQKFISLAQEKSADNYRIAAAKAQAAIVQQSFFVVVTHARTASEIAADAGTKLRPLWDVLEGALFSPDARNLARKVIVAILRDAEEDISSLVKRMIEPDGNEGQQDKKNLDEFLPIMQRVESILHTLGDAIGAGRSGWQEACLEHLTCLHHHSCMLSAEVSVIFQDEMQELAKCRKEEKTMKERMVSSRHVSANIFAAIAKTFHLLLPSTLINSICSQIESESPAQSNENQALSLHGKIHGCAHAGFITNAPQPTCEKCMEENEQLADEKAERHEPK